MLKSIITIMMFSLVSSFAFASADTKCEALAQRTALALYSVENTVPDLNGIITNWTGYASYVSSTTQSEVISVSFTNPEQESEVKYEIVLSNFGLTCSVDQVKIKKAG